LPGKDFAYQSNLTQAKCNEMTHFKKYFEVVERSLKINGTTYIFLSFN
jgi:hypothetical protein